MSSAPQAQFGRVPYAMIDAGGLRKMRGGDAAVYVAIAAHVKPDWTAAVGQRRIAKVTGFYAGRVSESIRRLADAGLIEVVKASGTRPATIRLCVTAEPSAKPIASAPAEPSAKPIASAPAGPSATDAQRSGFEGAALGFSSPSARAAPEQNRRTEKEQKQQPAAAIVRELTKAGIGEPKRSQLASLPGITVAIVRAAAEHANRHGKGPGIVVLEVEQRAAKALADADAATAACERREREQAERREHEAAVMRERAEVLAWRDALPHEERLRLRAEVLAASNGHTPRSWRELPDDEAEPFGLVCAMRTAAEQGEVMP